MASTAAATVQEDCMSWHYDGEIRIKRLEMPPFGTNCYIVACPRSGEGIIVDTPGEGSHIVAEAEGTDIKYIVITHTHFDHLMGFQEVRERLGAPVAIHALEAQALPQAPDVLLGHGDVLTIGQVHLTVLHTPGHTAGSICLLGGGHLFSGDTLFPGGPGKTASPDAFRQIIASITERLFVLPDDTRIYPGHGDGSVLGKEKGEYALFAGRSHDPGLCGDVLWLSS